MHASQRTAAVVRPVRFLAFLGAIASLIGVQAGCSSLGGGPKGPLTVPLEFKAEHSEPLSGSLPSGEVRVHVESVKDARENKDEIGRNIEDDVPVPVYAAAGKTPAEFIHGVLEEEMKNLGADVTDAPEAADRIISVELRKFFVEESKKYRAEVSAAVQVSDKGGKVLWKQVVADQGTTFGRSLNPENYQQTLSDATRRMIDKIVNNPGFKQALTR
jgi:hypothetical protein